MLTQTLRGASTPTATAGVRAPAQDQQQGVFRQRHQPQDRQRPALRVMETGQCDPIRGEPEHVLGQLSVQELARIRAAGGDQREVVQRACDEVRWHPC